MKLGAGLLAQLERCGLSAKLADNHREISESEFRETCIEIVRAFAVNDQATIPEAHAALMWLMGEQGKLVSVGAPIDLIDEATGEVLVSGTTGAVFEDPALVVAWKPEKWHSEDEPEDDLGLVALGLAAANGQPFRVAHVVVCADQVFPRRSRVFDVSEHASLLARIKKARSRPPIACPGEWCGACRQAQYCEAWISRARTALAVLSKDANMSCEGPDGMVQITQLDLTDDSAGAVMEKIKLIETMVDWAKEQIKSHVRHGGKCVVNGKEYYPGQRDGRESISVATVRTLTAAHDDDSPEVVAVKAAIAGAIKQGDSYEQFGWRKVRR